MLQRLALALGRQPRRLLSSSAATSSIARYSVQLAHENTYLSYSRNAIISTVAGGALVQYDKSQGRTPLAGAGMLAMGGLFMYSGTIMYIASAIRMRHALAWTRTDLTLSMLTAAWPVALWTTSLMCLIGTTPGWVLEGLRRIESHLPVELRISLFLDPPALYPACRLLQGVLADEQARLRMVRRHAAGHWSLTKPVRAPLTDEDVVVIITRRLERLELLQSGLHEAARSERAVPTAVVAPLLEKLRIELEQLEKVIEADSAPQRDWILPGSWWAATVLSADHRQLCSELVGVRRLLGRVEGVKFTAMAFAARGQQGVRPAGPEEARLLKGRWL